MHELREFEGKVRIAKLDLKEIYYTSRNENMKSDAKELVANVIVIQKSIERIILLRKKTGAAKVVLNDRKARMTLRKWTNGLAKRVKDFKKKKSKVRQEHLTRYQESLLKYIKQIAEELNDWIIDIETMADIPKPPS
jgi:hypothetical protein